MSETLPSFGPLEVHHSEESWGPLNLPDRFEGMPYAPYCKSDRLGKAADFTMAYPRPSRYGYGGGVNMDLHYKHDQRADEEFTLVDNVRERRGGLKSFGRRWYQPRRIHRVRDKGDAHLQELARKQAAQRRTSKRRMLRKRDKREERLRVFRESTVRVGADWTLLEQYTMSQLLALPARGVPGTEDGKDVWCGHLEYFDEAYDKVSAKRSIPLQRIENREFFYETTSNDPVIERLARAGRGRVFATDVLLAHLMASPRSVLPWDLVFRRVGEHLFIDKRDGTKEFDLVTVHENSPLPPTNEDVESINSLDNLRFEATLVNQNLSQQVLKRGGPRKTFDEPNPFFEEEYAEEGVQAAAVAYRYRTFRLDSGLEMVVRCELHGVHSKRGKEMLFNTYAVNEWDSKLSKTKDWRPRIDTQRGAVLGEEMKNNSHKLAKWTAQAMLAGADRMRIGFVSRKRPTDPDNHVVLGSQDYPTLTFARSIALNPSSMWAIVEEFVNLAMRQDSGTFLLVRDPNRTLLRFFRVPDDAFDHEGAEEGDDGEEEDDEDDE